MSHHCSSILRSDVLAVFYRSDPSFRISNQTPVSYHGQIAISLALFSNAEPLSIVIEYHLQTISRPCLDQQSLPYRQLHPHSTIPSPPSASLASNPLNLNPNPQSNPSYSTNPVSAPHPACQSQPGSHRLPRRSPRRILACRAGRDTSVCGTGIGIGMSRLASSWVLRGWWVAQGGGMGRGGMRL